MPWSLGGSPLCLVARRHARKGSQGYLSGPPSTMKNLQLEELHRLRAALEAVETRIEETEMGLNRIREEMQEAKLSITMLIESTKTLQEFGAETEHRPQPWLVGGIPS
jgi:hypothetical protein